MILPVDKLQELFVVYCPTGAGLAAVRWLGFVFCHYMRDERALLHESGIHQLVAEGQLCYLANLPQLSWLNEGCAILCTHTEEDEACTINTHTHTKTMDKCATLGHAPPAKGWCNFRELWASTRQTPEARPSTRRSTDCALQLWCGHPKSHLDLSGISTASGLVHPQPRPGSQFTIFLGPG